MQHRRSRRLVEISSTVIVLLIAVTVSAWALADGSLDSRGEAAEGPSPEHATLEVRLRTDGPSLGELVEVVRRQARGVPGAAPDTPIELVLTTDVAVEAADERAYLAGLQRGSTAWVRVDLAGAETTLVHEVAHVLTDGDGHGERWRAVYLGAVEELYGPQRAAREYRRIAWVHDRCYRDDSCPQRDDLPQAAAHAEHDPP